MFVRIIIDIGWLYIALAEFAKISVEFLRHGANPKIYSGAARE